MQSEMKTLLDNIHDDSKCWGLDPLTKDWGWKSRNNPEYGYASIWHNLITIRSKAKEPLPPTQCEFYDVSLGKMCNMHCPFCYTNAYSLGQVYPNVVDKIKYLFDNVWYDKNIAPYQVAIGSEGEPTIHPDFIEVLKTFHENGVVPNYTTNGKIFTDPDSNRNEIVEATNMYCGGVALSANEHNTYWREAFDFIRQTSNIKINLHMIASDLNSIKYIQDIMKEYDGRVWTYVILPLVAHGRSKKCMSDDAYDALVKVINEQRETGKTQVAVGARMYPWIIDPDRPTLTGVQAHEPEMFSKNLVLDEHIRITPSSFDTRTTLWQAFDDPKIFF